MKWKIRKNSGDYEDDKSYPVAVALSREGSSKIQLVDIECGNFTSSRTALEFIREVKTASIKREAEYPEMKEKNV